MKSLATISALNSMKGANHQSAEQQRTSHTIVHNSPTSFKETHMLNPFPPTFWTRTTARDLAFATAGLFIVMTLFVIISL